MLTLQELRAQARRGLGADMELSEAIPMGDETNNVLIFFHFYQHPTAPQLGEPTGLISINASTGELIGSDALRLQDWSILPADDPSNAGLRRGLQAKDVSSFRALRLEFELAAQQLVPLYFSGAQKLRTAVERDQARLLLDYWEQATEQGFMRYYLAVGWEWFCWLERVRSW